MGKRLTLVLMLVLAVAIVGTALTYAGGRGFRNGGLRYGRGDGPFANLDDDQRAALKAKVTEMKEAGATREEIGAARREMLEGYGIEVPENWGERKGRGLNLRDSLTEEQRTALHEKVTEMREAGAAREEILEARRTMLEGYGVELPENFGKRKGRGLNLRDSLTDEQRTALHEKVTEMREAGATREEIFEARRTMLEGYGVELPENFGKRGGGGLNLRDSLTEEQRTAIREKMEELKAQGATREEIRTAMGELSKELGIERPVWRGLRPRRGDGPFSNLTEEQRAAIREKVKELRGAGVPREEIRTAIAEMLEGYGIERPENPDTETEEVSKTVVSQNIPNPFNPITTIAYDLSEPSNVTLRVYAVTGQKVATLVSDYQQPGHHEVAWDGSGFANGVYVYRFEAGPFTETKRMLLLK